MTDRDQILCNWEALKAAGSAMLVECRDNETAEAIAGHKETGPLCLRAGPKNAGCSPRPSGQVSREGSPARLRYGVLTFVRPMDEFERQCRLLAIFLKHLSKDIIHVVNIRHHLLGYFTLGTQISNNQ